MKEIEKYLESENPDFITGFTLFCRYSRNQSLMSYIGRKNDMEMLLYNLKKIVRDGAKENPLFEAHFARFNKSQVIPLFENKPGNTGDNRDGNGEESFLSKTEEIISNYSRRYRREELPEELKPLFDKNIDSYKILRSLHEKMKMSRTDERRSYFRHHLVKLADSITDRWKLIHSKAEEYLKTKKGEPEPISAVQLNSARAYISKMLKKDKISEAQRLKIIEYYKLLKEADVAIKEETLQILKDKGFIS